MTDDLSAYRHIHFVGVGGIGMSALARYLLARGFTVSGSDLSPGDQGEALQAQGARIFSGHAAGNIEGADLVVVTSAAPAENPEIVAAHQSEIRVIKRAELLALIANAGRGVAVAGTHGKTTTSALVGHILTDAGMDPTILIGGISASLGSNARVGGSDLVVVEADEYDASFLRLTPEVAIITNAEPDHLDFYGTPERVRDAFRQFAEQVHGALIICLDDPDLPAIARSATASLVTYGTGGGDWTASDIRDAGGLTRFIVSRAGAQREAEMRLAGVHNVRNALSALAAAEAVGVDLDRALRALSTFGGVARRFEIKGEADGVLVVDDYGHHPGEVRTMLETFRSRLGRPIRLVFQPHTYSRTKSFMREFSEVLAGADYVYLMDIYPARETDTLGISGQDLAKATARLSSNVRYTPAAEDVLDRIAQEAQPGDAVITMGAGDVTHLGPKILDRLRAR